MALLPHGEKGSITGAGVTSPSAARSGSTYPSGLPPSLLHLGVELVDQRGHRQARAVAARLVEADAEVLAHPVDGEAEVELPAIIVLWRFSICQDCAAPFEMTSITAARSRPARSAKCRPSDRPCTRPAMQIWLTILVSWPRARTAQQPARARIGGDDRLGSGVRLLVAAAHDRQRAVLGAGLAAGDRRVDEARGRAGAASACSSRATSAEAVV